MTNIQEINNNFHEYTRACMEIIAKMESPNESTLTKQFVTLPIFDLDETLIHCELKEIDSAQKKIKLKCQHHLKRQLD